MKQKHNRTDYSHRKGKPLTLEEAVKSSQIANQHYRSNRGKIVERHLLRNYGLTLEDYIRTSRLQGDACAICRVSFGEGGKPPVVDHDHNSKKVRGLVCHGCNIKLAAVDNIEWLERALDYVQRWL